MGETLTEYVGPLPGPDTGKSINTLKNDYFKLLLLCFLIGFHRYVILVYQQPEKMAFLQEPRLNVTRYTNLL